MLAQHTAISVLCSSIDAAENWKVLAFLVFNSINNESTHWICC